ncbi:hypothetical protein [Metallibacterium scheffleri]|nr:hypothetical protein [Metallibacterium scheffleri]
MPKSKNPKITLEAAQRRAVLWPATAQIAEALRNPLPPTPETEAKATRRVAAWSAAWAQTPELVRAKFEWLEERVSELLRDSNELHRLKDRLAQERYKQDARTAKGGREPMATDEEITAALAMAGSNLGARHTVMRLDLETAAILNASRTKDGRELIAPATVADARRRLGNTNIAKPKVARRRQAKAGPS